MGKYVVVNKLCLGKETVGYRIDILEGSSKVKSIDINEKNAKTFLKMVGKDKIKKGVVIQGKLVNDRFITDSSDNILEVKSFDQAKSILDEYIFNSNKEVEGVMNSVGSTKIEGKLKGNKDTLEQIEFGKYKLVKEEYSKIIKALSGINYDFYVDEHQDSYSGELPLIAHVSSLEDLVKVYYRFGKSEGFNTRKIQLSTDNGTLQLCVDFNKSYSDIYKLLKGHIKNGSFELFYDNICCSLDLEGPYVFNSTLNIPGYNEMRYAEDKEELLKLYGLI